VSDPSPTMLATDPAQTLTPIGDVVWRTRARVGDRVRWYEEPEEIAHRTPEERR